MSNELVLEGYWKFSSIVQLERAYLWFPFDFSTTINGAEYISNGILFTETGFTFTTESAEGESSTSYLVYSNGVWLHESARIIKCTGDASSAYLDAIMTFMQSNAVKVGITENVQNSIAMYMRELDKMRINWAEFLDGYGVEASGKISSKWVDKFKEANLQIINGTLTSWSDDSVTKVRDYLFYNKPTLTSIDLPNATVIGDYAFYDEIAGTQIKTTKVNLPNAIKIGNYAFHNRDLSTAELDLSNVAEIGDYALARTGLTSFDFKNITKVGMNAFGDCNLVEIVADHDIEFGINVFSQNYNTLKRIIMPQQKKLPDYFASGYYTDYYDDKLEEIDLSSVEEIGESSLENHNLMKGYVFENVIKLSRNSFRNWGAKYESGQYELSFPKLLTLPQQLFPGCPHNLKLENTVSNGANALEGSRAEKISLFSLASIDAYLGGYSAGSGVPNLKELFLPELTTIKTSSAIAYFTAIEMIWAPKWTTITTGTNTINTNANLKYIYAPVLASSRSGMMKTNSMLEAINIGLVGTYNSTFQNSYSLKCVIIMTTTPPSISNITSATSSNNPFQNCYHLYGTVNETYNPNGDKDMFFYVPDEAIDIFKSATNWSSSVIVSQIKGHSEVPEEYRFLLTGEYNGEYKEDYEEWLAKQEVSA